MDWLCLQVELHKSAHDEPYETEVIHGAFIALLNGFVSVHQARADAKTAYIMTPMEDGVASAQQWEARGLVFNVRETPRPVRAKRLFSLFPRGHLCV